MSQYICPKQVAAFLGVAPKTARELMRTGEIPSFQLRGKLWRTTPARVSQYAESRIAAALRDHRLTLVS